MRALLIQVRAGDDPMVAHEAQCVRDRLGSRPVVLETKNAVPHRAESSWLDGVDLLFIGGSGDFSVHHPKSASWVSPLRQVLEHALERAIPGLAICFGHQLLDLP